MRTNAVHLGILLALAAGAGLPAFGRAYGAEPGPTATGSRPPGAQPTAAPWVHPGWGYRVAITANADSIQSGESFPDFPLLVSLDAQHHAFIFGHAKPDGSDLLFTAADGTTVLGREVVRYDAGGQQAEIWMRANPLSKTQNQFYLYYGNPDTTLSAAPAGAWSNQYRAIYHFQGNPGAGVLSDSSPAGANAVLDPSANWTSADVTPGQIGQAWLYNGTTHYTNTTNISTQDSSYVLSGWLKHTSVKSDFFIEANPGFWHTSTQVPGTTRSPDYSAEILVRWNPLFVPINAGYHHFAWVFDAVADTIVFYFDGSPQAVQSTYPENVPVFYTGRRINPLRSEPVGILSNMFTAAGDQMAGGADEYRIRQGAVSANWIRTEYRSQRDPTTFCAFGVEETREALAADPADHSAVSPAQSFPNPFQGTTSIRFTTGTLGRVQVVIYDIAGREVARLLDRELGAGTYQRAWDGRAENGEPAPSGVYFLRVQTPERQFSHKILLMR